LEILKRLDIRQMTVSELSRATALNKATIFEHLNKLCDAGLVKKLDDAKHKWVYYNLTAKGSYILHPEKIQIAILLSSAAAYGVVGIWQLAEYFGSLAAGQSTQFGIVRSLMGDSLQEGSTSTPGAGDGLMLPGTDSSIQAALSSDAFMYLAITVFVMAAFLVCAAVFLWKRRRKPDFLNYLADI
jgi:DNA-binding transcriptional ArsR family regulator